jgi:membrane-associated phospholipid phosphatase
VVGLLHHAVNLGLDALLVLLPISLFSVARALVVGRTKPARKSSSALALAGAATIGALCVSDLVLKPLFGRYKLGDLPQHFGFRFFGGTMDSGFPSGHATFAVAFFWALLILGPQCRILWATLIALTLGGLIFAQWHFLSDVAAGAMLGSFAATSVVAWARRSGRRQP